MVHTPAPQAYTRDTIAQAYEWLQTQPSHIRELANNTDGMVAMFLQAKRRGPNTLTSGPATSESFKQDLKTLAEGMRQFEERAAQEAANNIPTQVPTPAQTQKATPLAQTQPAAPIMQTNAQTHDIKTQQILTEVRHKLNLSTDQEAMRMLVAIGHERLSDILPKK
jgi:hypothetical protein